MVDKIKENKHDAINDLDKPLLKEVSYDSNKAVSFLQTLKQRNLQKSALSFNPDIWSGLIKLGYLFAGDIEKELVNA